MFNWEIKLRREINSDPSRSRSWHEAVSQRGEYSQVPEFSVSSGPRSLCLFSGGVNGDSGDI